MIHVIPEYLNCILSVLKIIDMAEVPFLKEEAIHYQR